jgi:hypothetical protein
MVRYEKDKERFDAELSTLFQYMDEKKEVKSVDVLATAERHENWTKSKIAEIDGHFFNTHAKMPRKKTIFFSWNDWLEKRGKEAHQKYYEEIVELSKEGTEWYDLMLKTHSKISVGSDLAFSLKYQRHEYAAMRAMDGYTDLVYMGRISSAWAYLYKIYPNLPRFVRASVQNQASQIQNYDANSTVRIIAASIEQVVSNQHFPSDQKEMLKEICNNLFLTYMSTATTNGQGDKGGVTSLSM